MELLLFCSELNSSFHPLFQEVGTLGFDLKGVTKEDFFKGFPHQWRNSSEGNRGSGIWGNRGSGIGGNRGSGIWGNRGSVIWGNRGSGIWEQP